MAIKICLTTSEQRAIVQLIGSVLKILEDAQLDWLGTPYQSAMAKIILRRNSAFSDSAVKFTEDEIGAIMCAIGAFGDDVRTGARIADEFEIDVTAFNQVAAKVSGAAEQRAVGVFGKVAMSNAATRGRQSGYWGLQKIKPEAFR